MKIHKYINQSIFALSLSMLTISCDDFLSIVPLNEVVLENFWTEKADVTSAVNGCYAALETPECITRMFVWGEMRSDNILIGSNPSQNVRHILSESILETNEYSAWVSFYQVINRCNTVLHYAPKVASIDPNYTDSELNATIAEMKTIRALCYFYLIRAFRDVPYITKPSLSDDNIYGDYIVGASSFDEILNNLIFDLEEVQDDAPKLYPNTLENSSRVTRCMIYTLLADLYLWKGDFDNTISYCEKVLDFKTEMYEEEVELAGTHNDIALFKDEYPLIEETTTSSTVYGNSYNKIFGTGNSFESIFELYFRENQKVKNSMISNFFISSSNGNIGAVSANEELYIDAATGNNDFFAKTDCRFMEGIIDGTSLYGITKYGLRSISIPDLTGNKINEISRSRRSSDYANWIIYRLTDVMLMKAEAHALKAKRIGEDVESRDSIMNANSLSSFKLVSAVYNRANCLNNVSKDTLVYTDYSSNLEQLVFEERRREFLFEGKRWFDLVRQSRRNSSTSILVNTVISKYKTNGSIIKIKLSSMDAIYFPYLEKELKSNPLLEQNPAYKTNESISK